MNVLAPPGPGGAVTSNPAEPVLKPAPVRAGRVVSTAGSQVIILLDKEVGGLDAVQTGSLVCVRSQHAKVYGIIEGLSTPMPMQASDGQELKIAEIGLLGEVLDDSSGAPGSFRRGVSKLPSLDATVYIATEDDTAVVYALQKRRAVSIGSVHQDPRVPARISVDDMLCKHFAMLGTTGTGKSCALTLILKRILDQNPNGHVLLLDPHGEYGRAFGARAEHLTKGTFKLPYWLCNFEELTEVVFGHDKQDMVMEIMHLRDLVLTAKMNFAGNARDVGLITADTPVPYAMGDLNRLIDQAIGSLENRSNLPPYLRLKARINSLQTDRRFDFMFETGLVVRDEFAALLGRILRVPANGRPLAILDLASIPSEVLNVVVAVICRLAFDFAVWGRPAHAAAAGVRGSPPLRAAGYGPWVRAGEAGAVAHRQRGPEIRHQPRCHQPAALRARLDHTLPMQHGFRLPHVERARPGDHPGNLGGGVICHVLRPAFPGQFGGDCHRRGRAGADAAASAGEMLEHVHFSRLVGSPQAGARVLAVLVTRSGMVRDRVLALDKDLTVRELETAANFLNENFRGRSIENVRLEIARLIERERNEYQRLLSSVQQLWARTVPESWAPLRCMMFLNWECPAMVWIASLGIADSCAKPHSFVKATLP